MGSLQHCLSIGDPGTAVVLWLNLRRSQIQSTYIVLDFPELNERTDVFVQQLATLVNWHVTA
jgi:hypothetical protein